MMNAGTDAEESREKLAGGKTNQKAKQQQNDFDDVDDGDDAICRKRRRIEEHRRWLLFGFSAVYTFLYVGSFYGWGPMQLLLEENGNFSWKCTTSSQNDPVVASSNTSTTVCSEQTYALLRINLVATVTQILSPLLGQFVDVYGAKCGFFVFTGCLWIGLVLLTVASSARYFFPTDTSMENNVVVVPLDRLLYVAFCFLAMATWMGGLLTVHTGLFFTGHVRSRVIFILNSLFDAGSITYLFLWWFPNVNLTIAAAGFLCSAVIITSGALYLWIVTVPQQDEIETTTRTTTVVDTPNAFDVAEAVDASENAGSVDIMNNDKQHEMIQAEAEEEESSSQQKPSLLLSSEKQNDNSYVIVADRTPRLQLLSTPYLLLCAYFAIHTTSNQWNLATQRNFLAYLGDDEQGNKYLTIFTLLMPASIVALPLVDYAILHFGFSGAFQTINALSLSYTTIKVSSKNLNVQILGFILFSFYRCFLFGVSISFLPTLIGPNVVGKAVGILYAVAGIMSFINIPFAKLAVEQLDGNFFIPNLIFCLLVLPCILLAFLIDRRIKQEDRAKSRRDTGGPKSEEKHISKPNSNDQ